VADNEKLLQDINEGLRRMADEALVFPVAEELPPLFQEPSVSLATSNIQPFAPVVLTKDQELTWFFNEPFVDYTIRLTARVLRADGYIVELTDTADMSLFSTAQTRRLPPMSGVLMSLSVDTFAPNTSTTAVYVLVFLSRLRGTGVTPSVVLTSGYVLPGSPLIWPGTLVRGELDWPGTPVAEAITGSTTGTAFVITTPFSKNWLVQSIRWRFTTSSAVANRFPFVTFSSVAGIYAVSGYPSAQTASQLFSYTAAINSVSDLAGNAGNRMFTIPPLQLVPSSTITISAGSIQAGDVIDNVVILRKEWSHTANL
jgi:hypothetical protein